LEVCYLEEKPALDKGPFLKEEKNLINAVAESIAKIIEHEEAEAEIRKHQDHIEALIKKTATKYFWKKPTNNSLGGQNYHINVKIGLFEDYQAMHN
jgi:hypothetical protein